MSVTAEDQNNINSFSKLNFKVKEVDAEVAARKKLLEDLEDASNELMLSDDDQVSLLIGECFVSFEKDDAEQRLEQMTEKVNGDLESFSSQLDEYKADMSKLKSVLYARLGNSINLEE